VSPSKKLTLLYLANDVMQHSRKKGDEFIKEFGKIIADAALATYQTGNETIQSAVERLLQIWLDRKLFPVEMIGSMKTQLGIRYMPETDTKEEQPVLFRLMLNIEKMEKELHDIELHIGSISEKLPDATLLTSITPKEKQGMVEVDALLRLLYNYESKLKLKQEQRENLCSGLLEEYQKQQKLAEEDVRALQVRLKDFNTSTNII
jgi:regulator of Ty1 transposition protein 103